MRNINRNTVTQFEAARDAMRSRTFVLVLRAALRDTDEAAAAWLVPPAALLGPYRHFLSSHFELRCDALYIICMVVAIDQHVAHRARNEMHTTYHTPCASELIQATYTYTHTHTHRNVWSRPLVVVLEAQIRGGGGDEGDGGCRQPDRVLEGLRLATRCLLVHGICDSCACHTHSQKSVLSDFI